MGIRVALLPEFEQVAFRIHNGSLQNSLHERQLVTVVT